MSKVIELGYVGFNTTKLDEWHDFATQCIGLEVASDTDENCLFLRMDNHHHRIAIHKSDEDDMCYMGWRVDTEKDLHAMAEKFADAGIDYRIASEEEVRERHVLGLIKLKDPSGIPTEIFWSPQVDVMKPFHPSRPMYGKFATGTQGLGHALIKADNNEATYKFYELLGLSGSVEYRLQMPNGAVAQPIFMTCNDRQHNIAFGLPGMEKNINHLMLEYDNIYDLGISHDAVRNKGIDVALQLGMHANDKLYTFYCATPSNWLLELGFGEDYKPIGQEHYIGDIFGHSIEKKGYGLDLPL